MNLISFEVRCPNPDLRIRHPGLKFCIESEYEVNVSGFRFPDPKNNGKSHQKMYVLIVFSLFVLHCSQLRHGAINCFWCCFGFHLFIYMPASRYEGVKWVLDYLLRLAQFNVSKEMSTGLWNVFLPFRRVPSVKKAQGKKENTHTHTHLSISMPSSRCKDWSPDLLFAVEFEFVVNVSRHLQGDRARKT